MLTPLSLPVRHASLTPFLLLLPLLDHLCLLCFLSPALSCLVEYPSAYSLLSHWSKYVKAVQLSTGDRSVAEGASGIRTKGEKETTGDARDDLPRSSKIPPSEYGVLGTAGFSAGGFLISPYAKSKHDPDVQLTVFPVVSSFPFPTLLLSLSLSPPPFASPQPTS
jgi:hypothetical protein